MLDIQTSRPSQAIEHLLTSFVPLGEDHLAFVRGRLGPVQAHPPEEEIAAGDPAAGFKPLLIASGWAAAAAQLEDGRRQIVSLFLAGDVIDPPLDLRPGLVAVALTPVKSMDAARLTASLSGANGPLQPLVQAWTAARQAAHSRLVRHVVRLGRLSAYERTAELLLELHARQRRAGLADDWGMPLPLTQEMLADHLGLSVVHMNRTLQQLRREDVIAYRAGRVMMRDQARLVQATRREAV